MSLHADHGASRRPPRGGEVFLLDLIRGMGLGLARVELLRDGGARATDCRLLDLDEAFERTVGIPVARAEGRTIRELAPEAGDSLTAWFDRVARGGRPARVVARTPVMGRWFELLAHPLDRDHLAVLYADVTGRTDVETRLRASEEHQSFMLRLSDALRSLDDPEELQRAAARELGEYMGVARVLYFAAEPAGDGDHVHVVERDHFARPGMASLVGRHPQAAYGRALLAGLERGETAVCDDVLAHPELTGPAREAFAAADVRAFVAVPLLRRGEYVGGLTALADVPRPWTPAEVEVIEQTAERTRAAVEQSRAEAAVGAERDVREARERDFVANAAHDLRTPLTGIVTALDALETGAKDRPAERDLFLAHLRRESDRMTRLCESLLMLTRADDPAPLPRRRLPVRALLEHVAADLEPRPGVALEVDAAPAATVVSNAGMLERVVANLADNAVKYTPEGRIVLRAARNRDVVVIEVRDTGTGISPEISGRVFDRFFRGGDRTRDGFGLGLAIASRAATALGGTLTLAPGPGGGTVARLALPDGAP